MGPDAGHPGYPHRQAQWLPERGKADL